MEYGKEDKLGKKKGIRKLGFEVLAYPAGDESLFIMYFFDPKEGYSRRFFFWDFFSKRIKQADLGRGELLLWKGY